MPIPALGSWVDWQDHPHSSQKTWVLISALTCGLLRDLEHTRFFSLGPFR